MKPYPRLVERPTPCTLPPQPLHAGHLNNPITKLANVAKVALAKVPTNYDNSILYYADGKEVPDTLVER
jgi:hypothetical protein